MQFAAPPGSLHSLAKNGKWGRSAQAPRPCNPFLLYCPSPPPPPHTDRRNSLTEKVVRDGKGTVLPEGLLPCCLVVSQPGAQDFASTPYEGSPGLLPRCRTHLGAQGLCRRVVEVPGFADLVQLRTLLSANTARAQCKSPPPLSASVEHVVGRPIHSGER